MLVTLSLVFLLGCQPTFSIISNRTGDFAEFSFAHPNPSAEYFPNVDKCTSRLHSSLEKLRKRQTHLKSTAFIDLSGYALHQTLRHLPVDMYVTDIKVRTPSVGDWVRIEKCQFSNRENKMTAQILFNDLSVSGTIQLLDDSEILKNSHYPIPREFCKMSLRFERAGLGINAFPTKDRSRRLDVKTEARFLDPKFLSVHAYGCKLNDIFRAEDAEIPETYETDPASSSVDERAESRTADGSKKYSSVFPRRPSQIYKSVPRKARVGRAREETPEEDKPNVRIISLRPEIRSSEDSKWFMLHDEHETDLNEFHRRRVLDTKFHTPTERDKIKAVLHVQKLIAEQANHVFQTQGPFSQQPQKPLFKPSLPNPVTVNKGQTAVGTITELDENLAPIRPVPQRPFDSLFTQNDQLASPSNAGHQNYYEVISREMEDVFLRGIKTLLTRYVEKQLEIPLKEALMVNIGYTVSYG